MNKEQMEKDCMLLLDGLNRLEAHADKSADEKARMVVEMCCALHEEIDEYWA